MGAAMAPASAPQWGPQGPRKDAATLPQRLAWGLRPSGNLAGLLSLPKCPAVPVLTLRVLRGRALPPLTDQISSSAFVFKQPLS